MNKTRPGLRKFLFGVVCAAMALVSARGIADARTDYLVAMLEGGGNYRVRVQAATTLGRLRAKVAVPALANALEDDNDLVVISAATALQQIGDFSVVPALERALKHSRASAVRSQLESTIRVLKALSPDAVEPEISELKPLLLIRVDAMGDSSAAADSKLVGVFRRAVVERLKQRGDVVLQPPDLTSKQIKARLKRDNLYGYILSGSILRLERVGDQMIAKLSLNVFSNPEFNLLMIPSAEGSVSISSGPLSHAKEKEAQIKVLERVAEGLVDSILEKLRQKSCAMRYQLRLMRGQLRQFPSAPAAGTAGVVELRRGLRRGCKL